MEKQIDSYLMNYAMPTVSQQKLLDVAASPYASSQMNIRLQASLTLNELRHADSLAAKAARCRGFAVCIQPDEHPLTSKLDTSVYPSGYAWLIGRANSDFPDLADIIRNE